MAQGNYRKFDKLSRRRFLKLIGGVGVGVASTSLMGRWPDMNVAAQSGDITVSSGSELVSAVNSADPGDTIVAEPGEYYVDNKVRATTPDITIRAQNDAVRGNTGSISHIIDDSGIGEGGLVELREDNITFRGFEISQSGEKGIEINGGGSGPSGVEVSHVDVHDCSVWGVMTNNGQNHVIRDSNSHHNTSPGDADGFNGTGSTNCDFIRCKAWMNADDGFDMWTGNNHYIKSCWSFNNTPGENSNGFKLGGGGDDTDTGRHRVENCVAFGNHRDGGGATAFDFNTSVDPVEVVNCTAFDNDIDFNFRNGDHVLRNNISAGSGGVNTTDRVIEENNTWNLGIDDPVFQSTIQGNEGFLKLSNDSPCIDAGVDVGIPYDGSSPDLGAFEYGTTSEFVGETGNDTEAGPTNSFSFTITRGSSSGAKKYVFTSNGKINKETENPEDAILGTKATGEVSTESDTYEVEGRLEGFYAEEGVMIEYDGETMTVEEFRSSEVCSG